MRLQCYEGLDEARALYEWNYRKQLLRIQAAGDAGAGRRPTTTSSAEEFLLARPLLTAIRQTEPTVLLIDETDKADVEVEGLLLEVLSDFQVTIPELGTIEATRRPFVVLTSNATRELSEALKRRCLFLHVDYPDAEREKAIVLSRVPEVVEAARRALVRTVRTLRALELKKAPSIAESIDWARTLVVLGSTTLDEDAVARTLGVVLKHASRPGARDQGAGPVLTAREPRPAAAWTCSTGTSRSWSALRGRGSAGVAWPSPSTPGRRWRPIDLLDREQLRAAYAATVVKRRPTGRSSTGSSTCGGRRRSVTAAAAAMATTGRRRAAGDGEPLDPRTSRRTARGSCATGCATSCCSGDDEALRRLAREAVNGLGRAEAAARPAVLVHLPRAARAQPRDADGVAAGGGAAAARSAAGWPRRSPGRCSPNGCGSSRRPSSAEVRRRLAEERGAETIAQTAVKPLVDQVEFLRASRDDLARCAAQVHPLARRLATRLTAKRRTRSQRPARRPSYGPGLAVHRRRPADDDLQAAQAAQARARRAVRRQRLGGGVRALHGAAGVRAARAVRQGAGVRLRRHHRRGHPVLRCAAATSSTRWRGCRPRPTSSGSTGTATTATPSRCSSQRWPDAVGPKTSLLVLGDAPHQLSGAGAAGAARDRPAGPARLLAEPGAARVTGPRATRPPTVRPMSMPMVECRNVEQLQAFVEGQLPV